MSTATAVPETYDLDGDDARETLQRVSPKALLRDTAQRMPVSGTTAFGQVERTAVRAGLHETRSADEVAAGEPDNAVVSCAAALRRTT